MTSFQAALQDLADLSRAIEPYGEHVVLVGGFAAWLYRFIGTHRCDGPHLFTLDIDYAVPTTLPPDLPSLARTLARSGFVSLRSRDQDPPVMIFQHHRWGNQKKAPIFVEFLAPLTGGRSARVTKVEPSLNAQLLRYMDLALERPVSLDLSSVEAFRDLEAGRVHLPHPANFVLQKALVLQKGPPRSRAKDFAYLFDVLHRTRPSWSEMAERVRSLQAAHERAMWIARARRDLKHGFGQPSSAGCLQAARVWNAHDPSMSLTAQEVHVVVSTALPAIQLW